MKVKSNSPTNSNSVTQSTLALAHLETRRLENKFDLLASQFASFCARFDENVPLKQTRKGKGRGKSSKPAQSDPINLEAEINAAAEKRLRQFLAENEVVTTPSVQSERPSRSCAAKSPNQRDPKPCTSRCSINDDMWTEDQSIRSSQESTRVNETTKTVYIKKVECQINQTPIDQVFILFFFKKGM